MHWKVEVTGKMSRTKDWCSMLKTNPVILKVSDMNTQRKASAILYQNVTVLNSKW